MSLSLHSFHYYQNGCQLVHYWQVAGLEIKKAISGQKITLTVCHGLINNQLALWYMLRLGAFTAFNQIPFQKLALGLELTDKPFLWVAGPGITFTWRRLPTRIYRTNRWSWQNSGLGTSRESSTPYIRLASWTIAVGIPPLKVSGMASLSFVGLTLQISTWMRATSVIFGRLDCDLRKMKVV